MYHIAGIFRGGKYLFFIKKSIFVCFIFVFASSALFYNTGGHTQFVKFRSLDSFLNEKKKTKIKPHENYLLYGMEHNMLSVANVLKLTILYESSFFCHKI